jgi:hypothetical protein
MGEYIPRQVKVRFDGIGEDEVFAEALVGTEHEGKQTFQLTLLGDIHDVKGKVVFAIEHPGETRMSLWPEDLVSLAPLN